MGTGLKAVGLILSIGAVIMAFFAAVYAIWFLAYIGLGLNIIGLVLMGIGNKKNRTKAGNVAFLAAFACLIAVVFISGFVVSCDGIFVR